MLCIDIYNMYKIVFKWETSSFPHLSQGVMVVRSSLAED